MRSRTHRMYWAFTLSLPLLGCAPKEYSALRPDRAKWLEADADAAANATDAKEPAILPKTYYAAGQLFEQQGQIHKAIAQYRKAADAQPDYVPAYNRMGVLLGKVGRHAEAEQALRQAVGMRPDWAFLRNNLGFEYMMQERWLDAEAELRNALRLQPDFSRAHNNLGVVLAKQGRYDEALAEFKEAMPESDALYNLGMMYRNQDKYEEAAGAFERAVSLVPNFPEAKAQLALVSPGSRWAQPSRPEPARADSETAVASAPLNPVIAEAQPRMEFAQVQAVEVVHAAEPADQPGAFAAAPHNPVPMHNAEPAPVTPAEPTWTAPVMAAASTPIIPDEPAAGVAEDEIVEVEAPAMAAAAPPSMIEPVDPAVLLVEARPIDDDAATEIIDSDPCEDVIEDAEYAAYAEYAETEGPQESPADTVIADATAEEGPCEDETTADSESGPIESYADSADEVSFMGPPDTAGTSGPSVIEWLRESLRGAGPTLDVQADDSESTSADEAPIAAASSSAMSFEAGDAEMLLCDFSAAGAEYFLTWADWREHTIEFHAGLPFQMLPREHGIADGRSAHGAITMVTQD